MRLLIDTHLIQGWMTADSKLGAAEQVIATADSAVSTVSLWALVLKNAKGKLPLSDGDLSDSLTRSIVY